METSNSLLKKLNCNFTRAEGKETKKHEAEGQDFALTFISVLQDIKHEDFERLSDSKNIFFIYGPPVPAYVKAFPLSDDALPISIEHLRIVVFEHEVMSYPRQALRWIIAHELAHAIFEKQDDDEANEIALGWGFKIEKEEFDRYEAEKRKGVE